MSRPCVPAFAIVCLFLAALLPAAGVQGATFSYSDSWSSQGLSIERESSDGLELVYSLERWQLETTAVDGELLQSVLIPQAMLPNDAGAPNLPGQGFAIAVPRGATARLEIVALRSESFASVEVHRTLMQDGMMRMEAVPNLTVNPGETVQLAPGGLHLMLMQPVEPTRPGEVHRIFIEFDDGSQQSLEMTVRK